jgi:Uma2 family endonuclease
MPTLLTTPPEIAPPQVPARKRWTRAECAELESTGFFKDERLELVAGELISKMGKNRPHVNVVTLLHEWLIEVFGVRRVNVEPSIDVAPGENPLNEPEPDLIVLKQDTTSYVSGNPQPRDISLLIEVSDTSLTFDRNVKAPLYARAGIADYWIVDIAGRRLFCHRNPIDGAYSSVVIYSEHEALSPLAAPDAEFRPSQVLPAI